MTEKRVKAWAVVGRRGEIAWADDLPMVFRTESDAKRNLEPDVYPGERVVPVVIEIQEEK